MDIRERMKSGKLYDPGDSEIMAEQAQWLEVLYDFNQTRPSQMERRQELMKKLFAQVGKNCYIEPPLHANWGKNTHLGDGVYANFNLTLVDDTDIYIGDHVMIGPNVTIETGTHPVCPELRERGVQYNLPVIIGANVWIGAGAILLPGVRVGENSVIGAGSLVNKDIPANVVAVGSPCRVLREITQRDREYYHKGWKIDME